MRIKRTVKYDHSTVSNEFPLDLLPEGDQVRVGFEKGTLKKATFVLVNGEEVIYEKRDE